MGKLSWTVAVQVTGKSGITASASAEAAEATDSVDVEIAPGDTDKLVEIQPGTAETIQLLLIKSDRYGPDYTFKVGDGDEDSVAVTLDAPQLYTGGSVALFGLAPRQLKFTNSSADKTANVEIFVARNATP